MVPIICIYLNSIMNQRTEANIGESNKTSVKVHHQPGGASNWSLGWEEPQQKPSIQKYHNQSSVVFGGDNEAMDEEEKKRKEEERKKKEEQINKNLPQFDPKMGNKTSVHFGDEKPDYRRKDQVFTSVKVHNPPGGRSNFQLG